MNAATADQPEPATTTTTDTHDGQIAQLVARHIPPPPNSVTRDHISAALVHAIADGHTPAHTRKHIRQRNPNTAPTLDNRRDWTRLSAQARKHVRNAEARRVAAAGGGSSTAAQRRELDRWRREVVRATLAALVSTPIDSRSAPAMMAAAHVLCAQMDDVRGWDTAQLSAADAAVIVGCAPKAGATVLRNVERLRLLRRVSAAGQRGRVPRWRLPAQPRGERIAAGRALDMIIDDLVDDLLCAEPASALAATMRSVDHPAWCYSGAALASDDWARQVHWAALSAGVPVADKVRTRAQGGDTAGRLVSARTGTGLRAILDDVADQTGARERRAEVVAARVEAAAARAGQVVAYRAGRVERLIVDKAGDPAEIDPADRPQWAATAAEVVARRQMPMKDRHELGRRLTVLLEQAGWPRAAQIAERIVAVQFPST